MNIQYDAKEMPIFPQSNKLYRALLSTGKIFDFLSTKDDSDVRAWILEYLKIPKSSNIKIVGVTEVVLNEEN